MQASIKALEFYEAWADYHQPLSKFDLVSVPGKTGAMEYWGLLLFDEDRFLVNPVCMQSLNNASFRSCTIIDILTRSCCCLVRR